MKRRLEKRGQSRQALRWLLVERSRRRVSLDLFCDAAGPLLGTVLAVFSVFFSISAQRLHSRKPSCASEVLTAMTPAWHSGYLFCRDFRALTDRMFRQEGFSLALVKRAR